MSSKMVKRRSRQRDMSEESLDQLVGQGRRTPRVARASRGVASPPGGYPSARLIALHRSGSSKDTVEQVIASSGAHIIRKVARAFFARMLFVVHSVVTIWQTVEVYDNQAYWGFALITVAILIEGSYTILVRAGDERKWFCPSVMLYIIATAPPIWLLEMDMSRRRFDVHFGANDTTRAMVIKRERERLSARSGVSEGIGGLIGPMGSLQEPRLQLESTFRISHELWVQLLEQFLLVILIIGRWMLPKGEITREQLSQILLAYLAIASDIVELFDVFKESSVVIYKHLQYAVLGIWSLSLFQFPFVLTVSRARKMRVAVTKSNSEEDLKRLYYRTSARMQHQSTFHQILHDVDIWAILLANSFQDIPFFMVRLYLMLAYQVMTYTMIFFTCKNALIIMLQTYRAFILINDRYFKPTEEEDAAALALHYTEMLTQASDALTTLKRRKSHRDAVGGGGGAQEREMVAQSLFAHPLPTITDQNDNSPVTPKKRRKSRSPRPSPGQRSRTSEGRTSEGRASSETKKMPRQRRRRSFNEDGDEWGSGSGLGVGPSDYVEQTHRSPAKSQERRVKGKSGGPPAEGRASDAKHGHKSPRKYHDKNANTPPQDNNTPRKRSRRISSESENSLQGRTIPSRQHKRSIGMRPGALDSPIDYPIREEREDLFYP